MAKLNDTERDTHGPSVCERRNTWLVLLDRVSRTMGE
jgi:hypothetical protein